MDSAERLSGGRTTALKKCVISSKHRYLYVTPTFKISLFSWSWAEQRENKKKHTHMYLIINKTLTIKPYFDSGAREKTTNINTKTKQKT